MADKPSAGFVKCYLRYKASLSVRTPDLPVYRGEERKGAVFNTFILKIFKAPCRASCLSAVAAPLVFLLVAVMPLPFC